ETTLHSSWMVALLAVPIVSAYGVAFDGGWLFPFVALAAFVPFLVIPAAIGSAATLFLVTVFPARRTRDLLGVVAVLGAAGVVVLLRLARPEQLARPDGFRSLVEFVTVLRGPTSPLLPSEWTQQAIMAWLTWTPDALPLYLLWTTAGAFVVFGALAHRALYRRAYSRAQEGAGQRRTRATAGRLSRALFAPLGAVRRELVLKEIRVFFRDATQWSQLILLGVLLVVYVFNIKMLPLRSGESVGFFLINVIPFLNLGLAGFVLASIAVRFLFPGVSLEGRTLWLLRSSPLRMRDLLWAKFWVGTVPLLVLAVTIVTLTNVLLEVSQFMFALSLGTIVLLTFALAGLALGLGALFPRFETESAAQIPTSFGGLVFMMAAAGVIGGVVTLEARPVYAWLRAQWKHTPTDPLEMVTGLTLAALLCIAACVLPLVAAERKLEERER
ncbi:MAG TPA: hypothetical protein VFY16_01025, partial [Gemmatimonadaceae bacterium]|nr:hypothetical protein [Gemmatimonadaceae bacterium]